MDIIRVNLIHQGQVIECSPIKISHQLTLWELRTKISEEIGETAEHVKLKRKDEEVFPDDWNGVTLGMHPVGIKDNDALHIELPIAGYTSPGETRNLSNTLNVELDKLEISSDEQKTSSDNLGTSSATLNESLGASIKAGYHHKAEPSSPDYQEDVIRGLDPKPNEMAFHNKIKEGKKKFTVKQLEMSSPSRHTDTEDEAEIDNKLASLDIEDLPYMLDTGNRQEDSFGNYSSKSHEYGTADGSFEYDNATLEDAFQHITCTPGKSKTFLDNTAKISCADNHVGCKFRTRFTPNETFEEIAGYLRQENLVICGPMIEIQSIVPTKNMPPYCSVSLRHYLSLPQPSHAIKSNYQEEDKHFVVRITKDDSGNWQIIKIQESYLNPHSVTWPFNEFSHVLCAGNLKNCSHPFHLSIFFLRLKSDEQAKKCKQKKVEVHLVVRYIDASDNKDNWDDPETTEKNFKQKYIESQKYVEAATALPITIPGGGQFSLVIGLKEGLLRSLEANFPQQLEKSLFERCGSISIQDLAKEKGAQLVWRMDNSFPYKPCKLANLKGQDTRASLRARISEREKYVNPVQLFQNEGTGMALTITSCPCKSNKMQENKDKKPFENENNLIQANQSTNKHGKEYLLQKSIPLLEAFKKGDADLSDLKHLCTEMGLMDHFGASLTSVEEISLSERAKQMICRWYMKKGKEATIEVFIGILNKIEMVAISEAIQNIL